MVQEPEKDSPDGARITDHKIGMVADLYFKPEGIFCDLDKNNTCEHIDFALTIPAIQNIIRKRRLETTRHLIKKGK